MFQDQLRHKVWSEIRQHDLRAFARQLTPEVFAAAAQQAGVRIGRNALNVVQLVWLGLAAALQPGRTFASLLTATLKLLEDQEQSAAFVHRQQRPKASPKAPRGGRGKSPQRGKRSKHDPRREDPTQVSEEAFVQARQRMPQAFWKALLTLLAAQLQQDHPQHLAVRGFRLLALDGSTLPLPNLPRLRTHYGRPKNGQRQKAAPQARLVMLSLLGVRIPLAYEVAPLADSELTLAGRLLGQVRSGDLVLMDRGYLSYGLFWQLQQRQACFGTRLKKGLALVRQRRLGPKDYLVEWTPKDSRRQWKDLPRSITLRVIEYQVPGFRASAILTNVLDPRRLSRADWVRLAEDCERKGQFTPGLYHRRWEIETSFFELKIGLRVKALRSRTPASLEYELAGRMVLYLLVRWLIVLAAEAQGLDPLRISFTEALRELEQMRAALTTSSATWAQEVLLPRLLERIASHVVPLRPGRHYPRPKDRKVKDCGHGSKQRPSKLTARVNTKSRASQSKPRRKA